MANRDDEESVDSEHEEQQQEDDSPEKALTKCLTRLYREMCQQDAEDWTQTYNEQAKRWSASDVLEKIQTLQTQAGLLERREAQILQQSRELGLLDASCIEETQRLRGLVPPSLAGLSNTN